MRAIPNKKLGKLQVQIPGSLPTKRRKMGVVDCPAPGEGLHALYRNSAVGQHILEAATSAALGDQLEETSALLAAPRAGSDVRL